MAAEYDFDASVDYYHVLGVAHNASLEEIKNAHVTLALKHHPDLSTDDDGGKRFRSISEAWATLGKAERRRDYDLARIRSLGPNSMLNPGGAAYNPSDASEISESFNTQKTNFHVAVQYNASSNWRELQDKYKTERWQNMPLSEKKLTRVRGVQTLHGTIAPMLITLGIVGFVGYSYYSSRFPPNRRSRDS